MRRISWRKIVLATLASIGMANVALADGPWPFTQAWYAERADAPPGARQVESHGKLWPPYPRPIGPKQTKLHTYHYSHYWPYPHNIEDEAYTRNIIALQTGNGWASATTLHDYHFNAETQQLTDGGRSHLLWISQNVPPQYRTVYIAMGASSESAQLRVANSEQFYREMGIPNPPGILARGDVYTGRPAVEVDRIRQLELLTIPKPRLFYIGAATAGQTAGGGVAGGAGGPVGGAGATSTQGGSVGGSR